MQILSARKYPSPRNGPLSLEQAETRRLAYAIKDPKCPACDIDTAAREMAAALLAINPQPSTISHLWLVPIPGSTGDTTANTRLASAIACHVNANAAGIGAQVVRAIRRTARIESQCVRHRQNRGPTPTDEHHMATTGKQLTLAQVYFVDNVTTSGHTLLAARNALGRGAGLVFADAGNHSTPHQQPTLL